MLILFHGRRLNTFLRGFYCTDCCEVITVHCRVGEGVWSWFTLNDEHEKRERHMRDCRAKHLRDALPRGSGTAPSNPGNTSEVATASSGCAQRDSPTGAAPDTASRPTAPDKGVGA